MNLSNYKATIKKSHKIRTLIFLIKDDQVLLGFKKNGFGKGYVVGIGGKVEGEESAEEAAIREFEEEVGVKISLDNLNKVAILNFYFPEKPDESWDQQVYTYLADKWEGEIKESEEIKAEWVAKEEVPLDKMWDDASYWLPFVLEGKKVNGDFLFDKDLRVSEYQVKFPSNLD